MIDFNGKVALVTGASRGHRAGDRHPPRAGSVPRSPSIITKARMPQTRWSGNRKRTAVEAIAIQGDVSKFDQATERGQSDHRHIWASRYSGE